ncbi:hypothetical protein B0J13DRAFT_531319 [Dactylonectria estremocensis]|uniref:Uncharacterized protein n=1 Tax=Dactylonectria estremocensis TaxID=1079267 RepID=A0A9P9DSC7_9HYPO|nr:hypothetical protein B0J13DRAFT_531319 [Dactylonectria estremocensis]
MDKGQQLIIDPFIHIPEYPFPICKVYKFAYVAKEAFTYWNQRYASTTIEASQICKTIIISVAGGYSGLGSVQSWTVPSPVANLVPHIPPLGRDGFSGQASPYHCKKEHGWVNDRKKVDVMPNKPLVGKTEELLWAKYPEKWRILMSIWVRVQAWEE